MIYKALRLTREFHRMKQVDLASRLEISPSYLSEIEAGKKPVTLEIMQGYAKVFDIPAATFLLFEERTSSPSDEKRKKKAEKILQFLEWVASEDDEIQEKQSPPGKTKKAVRA